MSIGHSKVAVGFIGTGVMGSSMAGHVQDAGYEVHLYTRTKAKAQPLLDRGMLWQDSPAEVARRCDIVITMVGYPSDVEATYLGEDGIVAHAREGALLIDMTTSSPALAQRIYDAAAARGVRSLDAPVSGGDIGARNGTLSIMIGGDEAVFTEAKPVLEAMGKTIVRQGGPGAGQHTKMVNQIAIASGMIGVCEALIYAKHAGLDPNTVLSSIETGAAGSWSLSNLGPRIIRGDFEPGFYVKHFIKDMGIALEAAAEMELDLPGLTLARSLYGKLEEAGFADKGTQALYLAWQE